MTPVKKRLETVSAELVEVRKQFQPKNGLMDANLRIFEAVSVAVEQVDYAIHILSMRGPEQDPNQASFPGTHPAIVSIAIPEWCDSCDNPKTVCTCHR